jgi:LacI family transcriptional regulator
MSTYKEIAHRSGVSIGTVYRVLHRRGRFSAKTALRVRKVAQELGYRKNIYASNLSRSRTYLFAIVMPDPTHDNEYWAQPYEGIRCAVASLGHYRVESRSFFYDEHEPDSFSSRLDEARSCSPDGLIIAPSLAVESEDLVQAANLTVPHVMIDSAVPSAGCVGFVGQDGHASGRAAGRLLELLAPGNGTIVAVRSVPASRHLDRRIAGLRDYLIERDLGPPVEIDIDFGRRVVTQIGHERLESIVSGGTACFVSNSNASLFADALVTEAATGACPVVGYDLVPANVRALADGRLTFLLSQRPHDQGRIAVDMLHRAVILGEPPEGTHSVPIDIVSAETLASHR